MRILPFTEWARLAGTELEAVYPQLPADAAVLVVERGGAIVGCWARWQETHVHGLWIAPDARKRGGVARRLYLGMRRLLKAEGRSRVMTSATSEEVRALLLHVGAAPMPGDPFVMGV